MFVRSTREPRENIPESLQCVICLGAEREVRIFDLKLTFFQRAFLNFRCVAYL